MGPHANCCCFRDETDEVKNGIKSANAPKRHRFVEMTLEDSVS